MLDSKDPGAERWPPQPATSEEMITIAVQERFERVKGGIQGQKLADELGEIALRCAALPIQDDRTDDEILGYDEAGLPR